MKVNQGNHPVAEIRATPRLNNRTFILCTRLIFVAITKLH